MGGGESPETQSSSSTSAKNAMDNVSDVVEKMKEQDSKPSVPEDSPSSDKASSAAGEGQPEGEITSQSTDNSENPPQAPAKSEETLKESENESAAVKSPEAPSDKKGDDAVFWERSEAMWREFYEDELNDFVTKPFGGRTAKLVRKAKRDHRTDVKVRDWGKYEHYKRWPELRERLKRDCLDNVKRIHGDCYSLERFRQEFEQNPQPCLIHGLADDWPARTEWGLKRLREEFGERRYKCGEDDEGYAIKLKLKHFLRYMNGDTEGGAKVDDSPLYIFDSHFDDDRISKQFLQEYKVPHLFKEDLFRHVGSRRRPPHRWMLIGPERSGTGMHDDPLGTSAWNTLIRGHKLWTLFPPDIPKSVIKGRSLVNWDKEDDEPIDWNDYILPRILEKGGPELRSKMIQFIQKPGETVFVPSDWWHAVLNLDTTVAVTQNFCSTGNFDRVWRQTRTGRRKMARTWRKALAIERKDLEQRSYDLDKLDNFDLDQEIDEADERRRRRKVAKKEKKRREQEDRENEKSQKKKESDKDKESASSSGGSNSSGSSSSGSDDSDSSDDE